MFIINLTDILTLSESSDIEMIMVYQQYVRRPLNKGDNQTKISKKMGYVTNVNDAKEVLEKIFKRTVLSYQPRQRYSTHELDSCQLFDQML